MCRYHKYILIRVSCMHVASNNHLIWSNVSVIQPCICKIIVAILCVTGFKIILFICTFEFLGNIFTNWFLNKIPLFSIIAKELNTRKYTGVDAVSCILISYIHTCRLSHWSLVMLKYHTTQQWPKLSQYHDTLQQLYKSVNFGPNKKPPSTCKHIQNSL